MLLPTCRSEFHFLRLAPERDLVEHMELMHKQDYQKNIKY